MSIFNLDLSALKRWTESRKKLLFANLSSTGNGYWRRFTGKSKSHKQNLRKEKGKS